MNDRKMKAEELYVSDGRTKDHVQKLQQEV